MPILSIGRSRNGDGWDSENKVVGSSGVVESDGAGGEVDLVGNIVPHISLPGDVPLSGAANNPSEKRVSRSSGTGLPSTLHFSEMALEESDLVLMGLAWCVGGRARHAEVVEDLSGIDGCGSLGDQLCSSHGLAVPESIIGQADLDSLRTASVGRVLESGIEVDVRSGSIWTVLYTL